MTPEPADVIRAALVDAEGWERMLNARDALTELERRLAQAEAERDHYLAHGRSGTVPFSRCVATMCLNAREALRAEPAKGQA